MAIINKRYTLKYKNSVLNHAATLHISMYHHHSKEERKPPDKETVGSFLRVVPRLQICYCDEPFDSWNHHSSSRILIYFEKWRNRRERRLNEHIGLIKVEKLCVCAQSAVFQDGVDGRTTNKI